MFTFALSRVYHVLIGMQAAGTPPKAAMQGDRSELKYRSLAAKSDKAYITSHSPRYISLPHLTSITPQLWLFFSRELCLSLVAIPCEVLEACSPP